jgi:ribonuclease R
MMIEEFMVLANEEVAKWCTKHSLPFLSRIHHLPPEENAKIIREIIGLAHEDIHPTYIRQFLDALSTENQDTLYKYSRLLLPKMAKAFYSDKAHIHFGLALEYYSHFTSPIRRYPDLQVHRIIKEELHKTLDKKRKEHYRHILKKIAKKCSDGEVHATDVERAVDSIIICRYMSDKIGSTYA